MLGIHMEGSKKALIYRHSLRRAAIAHEHVFATVGSDPVISETDANPKARLTKRAKGKHNFTIHFSFRIPLIACLLDRARIK